MPPNVENLVALPPGHRLGEYRIERYLGSGGFGITYSAVDEHLDHRVAIKEYLPKSLAMRDANDRVTVATAEDEADFRWGLDRFLDEARALAHFDHPNIVGVKRFLEAHGTGYIVMEYVDGEPLSEMLKRKPTLTEAEIREHVLPLAAGLSEIHAAGLLHRDIKPSNIVVRANGVPVLIDFGSARRAVSAKSLSLTAVVTDGYAPLEQYSSDAGSQTEATDIYGLGAVLYRCVAGVTPRNAPDRALDDQLLPAAEAADGRYSEGLLTAIDAALAIRLEDRPCGIAVFLKLVSLDATPAIDALKRHDYQRALDGFRALAELGFATAHYNLANMYFFGRGVAEDRSQAVRFVTKAAERGHERAQLGLARWYANGENVEQDHDQAVHWYSRATKQGNEEAKDSLKFLRLINDAEDGSAFAQYQLGKMYRDGKGTPKDDVKAVEWFTRAAEQGLAIAQYSLGRWCYYNGNSSEDPTQAIQWLIEAAESGAIQAQFTLGEIYEYGYRVPKDDAQAVKWYTPAAEQGHPDFQYRLGYVLYRGEGSSEDHSKGIGWLTEAAEQGHADAQYQLGYMALQGYDISMDDSDIKASVWLIRAAEQGHLDAQIKLGEMYGYRSDCDGPDNHHLEVIKEAESGYDDAQYELGLMYESGNGVYPNDARALQWLTRAAEQGHLDAQIKLGRMYRYNQDNVWECVSEEDHMEALRWYELAAEQGDADAQYQSGSIRYDYDGAAEAVSWFKLAADQGHTLAQHSLGCMIADNLVSDDDFEYQDAVRWFVPAAEQGDAVAQYHLGCVLRGAEPDEASKWFVHAADQGYVDAQYQLGLMCVSGVGVPQDLTQAIQWFARAAKQGHAGAQFDLGRMYANGEGVRADNIQAFAWAHLASARGRTGAAPLRDNISANLSQEQLTEARQLSRELETRIQNSR